MASRPIWKGYLKLSLVSVPVKLYTVTDSSKSDITLNQLHEECHSRIRYQKTCPIHGKVDNDEIISGYQIGEDQYVPIDVDELKELRKQSDQSIEIGTFIRDDQLDDRFLTERSYYVVPDGKVGQKPYALIRQTLQSEGMRAIADIILSKREQHVVVRPLGKLLLMTVLQHAGELKKPTVFEEEIDDVQPVDQELKLTRQLVAGLVQDDWDYSQYHDTYQARLSELIAAKVEGKELVKAEESDGPAIINLMDALKASIQQIPAPSTRAASSKSGSSSRAKSTEKKPAKKVAASTPRTKTKRKTSKRKTG